MELQKSNGTYIVSREEYEFLQEAKACMARIRNSFFSEGRKLNDLAQKAEKLQKPAK